MPIFARSSSQYQLECEHCSFSFQPSSSSADGDIRCPRCWRPVGNPSPSQTPDTAPSVFFASAEPETAESSEATRSRTDDELPGEAASAAAPPEADNSATAHPADIWDEELSQLSAEDLAELGLTIVPPPDAEQPAKAQHVFVPDLPIPDESADRFQHQQEQPALSLSARIKRAVASYSVSLLIHLLLMFLAGLIVYQVQEFQWHAEIEGARDSLGAEGGLEVQAPVEFQAPPPSVHSEATDHFQTGNFGEGFGGGAGDGGIGFFGTRARGKSFAFVVDISGSMTGMMPQPPPSRSRREAKPPPPMSRWDKAREELLSAIDAMTDNQSFSVMLYNDNHYTFTRDGEPVGMMRATQENKDDIRAWLGKINAGGGTQPQVSLQQALKMKPEVVFFLTDGIIPAQSREIAAESNIGDSVIHTTCIGSPENEILQLIANDHRGRFRSVGGQWVETGADGITLVCFVSSEPSHRLKFKRIEEDLRRFNVNIDEEDRNSFLLDDNSHSLLILHNAASDVPKFNLELQKLLRELNSGTRSGFGMELKSGSLGIGVPLDDLDLRYSDSAIAQIARETMTIGQILESSVAPDNLDAPQTVNAIYVFGDLDAKQEVLTGLEVFNLYNGSIIRLVDGEEFVRRRR